MVTCSKILRKLWQGRLTYEDKKRGREGEGEGEVHEMNAITKPLFQIGL
jgi:hypothetical protein